MKRIPDRIFEDAGCSAYGCPLDGSMSLGTGARKKWWCSFHFGRDYASYQEITAEINRIKWLAFAIRDIRRFAGNDKWPEVYARIKRDIKLAQRSDLLFLGNAKESRNAWLARLEDAMNEIMQPVLRGTMQRSRIYPECIHADSVLNSMKCFVLKRNNGEENGES